jgi:hypothetical protein
MNFKLKSHVWTKVRFGFGLTEIYFFVDSLSMIDQSCPNCFWVLIFLECEVFLI